MKRQMLTKRTDATSHETSSICIGSKTPRVRHSAPNANSVNVVKKATARTNRVSQISFSSPSSSLLLLHISSYFFPFSILTQCLMLRFLFVTCAWLAHLNLRQIQ